MDHKDPGHVHGGPPRHRPVPSRGAETRGHARARKDPGHRRPSPCHIGPPVRPVHGLHRPQEGLCRGRERQPGARLEGQGPRTGPLPERRVQGPQRRRICRHDPGRTPERLPLPATPAKPGPEHHPAGKDFPPVPGRPLHRRNHRPGTRGTHIPLRLPGPPRHRLREGAEPHWPGIQL